MQTKEFNDKEIRNIAPNEVSPGKYPGDEEVSSDKYPGADVNRGDNDKNTPCLRKQDVRILNNNPRNNDIDK